MGTNKTPGKLQKGDRVYLEGTREGCPRKVHHTQVCQPGQEFQWCGHADTGGLGILEQVRRATSDPLRLERMEL